MPEYLSPGVYVEEVDAGPKPIAPVADQQRRCRRRDPPGPDHAAAGDQLRRLPAPVRRPARRCRPRRPGRCGTTGAASGTRRSRSRRSSTRAARGCTSSASSPAAPSRPVAPSTGGSSRCSTATSTLPTPPSGSAHVVGIDAGATLDVAGEDGSTIGQVTVGSIDHATRTLNLSAPAGFSARRGQDAVVVQAVDTTLERPHGGGGQRGGVGRRPQRPPAPRRRARASRWAPSRHRAPLPPRRRPPTRPRATPRLTVAAVVGSIEATTPVPFSVRAGGAILPVSAVAAAGRGGQPDRSGRWPARCRPAAPCASSATPSTVPCSPCPARAGSTRTQWSSSTGQPGRRCSPWSRSATAP